MQDCIFCKIIAGQIPTTKIAETDDLIVIKDIAPKAPVHYLIIPKKHSKDIRDLSAADAQLGSQIFAMAQQLARDLNDADFRLMVSNGYEAGQRVFHTHIHFLSGGIFAD